MAAQQKPGTGKPGSSTLRSHPKALCISYQRLQSHLLFQLLSPAGSANTALCSPSPSEAAISDTDEDNNGRGKKGSRERSGHGEQSTAKERKSRSVPEPLQQVCHTWSTPGCLALPWPGPEQLSQTKAEGASAASYAVL